MLTLAILKQAQSGERRKKVEVTLRQGAAQVEEGKRQTEMGELLQRRSCLVLCLFLQLAQSIKLAAARGKTGAQTRRRRNGNVDALKPHENRWYRGVRALGVSYGIDIGTGRYGRRERCVTVRSRSGRRRRANGRRRATTNGRKVASMLDT